MKKFESWPEVLAYAKTGAPLYYQAPMDHHATRLTPAGATPYPYTYRAGARTIRIWPPGSIGRGRSRTADPFNADAKHLERFSRAEETRGVGEAMRAHRNPADDQAATELVMFIENESDLSPDGPKGQGRSVLLNALRKWKKGTYDPALAVRLFEYLVESGAKRYAKEFGSSEKEWSTMFTPATRKEAAKQFEASFRSSAESGEYDHVDVRTGQNEAREAAPMPREPAREMYFKIQVMNSDGTVRGTSVIDTSIGKQEAIIEAKELVKDLASSRSRRGSEGKYVRVVTNSDETVWDSRKNVASESRFAAPKSPRGIYHNTSASHGDYVIHVDHRGAFVVDRIGRGGTHTTIGPARGYATLPEALSETARDSRIQGNLAGVVFFAHGDDMNQIGNIKGARFVPGGGDTIADVEKFVAGMTKGMMRANGAPQVREGRVAAKSRLDGGGAENFREFLEKAVILVAGEAESSIDVDDKTPVNVSIVVNVTGYGPNTGAIYAKQNQFHDHPDEALQAAYEILEEWEMENNQDYYAELEKEYGDEANGVFTETFDGRTWRIPASSFAKAIEGTDAAKYIETHSSKEDD